MTESQKVVTEQIELPTLGGERPRASLAYLVKSPSNAAPPLPFRFLHTVRSGSAARTGSAAWAHEASSYYRDLSKIVRVVEQWSETQRFDTALLAPSSRRDGEPYLAAIMHRHRDEWTDLSPYFTKRAGFHSGSAGTFSETVDAITCSVKRIPSSRDLLIVDDVYSRGFTPGAMVHYLRTLGLEPATRITIFAPVWMPKP